MFRCVPAPKQNGILIVDLKRRGRATKPRPCILPGFAALDRNCGALRRLQSLPISLVVGDRAMVFLGHQ